MIPDWATSAIDRCPRSIPDRLPCKLICTATSIRCTLSSMGWRLNAINQHPLRDPLLPVRRCYVWATASPREGFVMSVVGISAGRKNKVTESVVKAVLDRVKGRTVFISWSGKMIRPCEACNGCVATNRCVLDDDFLWAADQIRESDGLVFGAPNHFKHMNSKGSAFWERCVSPGVTMPSFPSRVNQPQSCHRFQGSMARRLIDRRSVRFDEPFTGPMEHALSPGQGARSAPKGHHAIR